MHGPQAWSAAQMEKSVVELRRDATESARAHFTLGVIKDVSGDPTKRQMPCGRTLRPVIQDVKKRWRYGGPFMATFSLSSCSLRFSPGTYGEPCVSAGIAQTTSGVNGRICAGKRAEVYRFALHRS